MKSEEENLRKAQFFFKEEHRHMKLKRKNIGEKQRNMKFEHRNRVVAKVADCPAVSFVFVC